MTRVTIYGKPGCHLCDDARRAVHDLRAGREFEIEEIDITLDPGMERRYRERIPVIALDGEEISDFVVDATDLAGRLDRVKP